MAYRKFLRKSAYWRYGIFIATIVFIYYAIQASINMSTINASIDEVETANELLREEMAYKENFYKNYLEWEYAPYFLWHENAQLYENEQIIRLRERKPETVTQEQLPERELDENLKDLTPQESRWVFIERRLSPLKELWIIQ